MVEEQQQFKNLLHRICNRTIIRRKPSSCINYVHSWRGCAFSVRHIPMPGEDMLSWWSTSPFPVRHIPIPGEDVHSRWGTSHIPIPGEDTHFRWSTSPFSVRICISGEDFHSIVVHPHWQCMNLIKIYGLLPTVLRHYQSHNFLLLRQLPLILTTVKICNKNLKGLH